MRWEAVKILSGCYVLLQLTATTTQLVDIIHKKARQQPGI